LWQKIKLMKKLMLLSTTVLVSFVMYAQQLTPMPGNIKKAYINETRSADGKPGKNYWQNFGKYNINVRVTPPSKRVDGTETITYFNRSPKDLKGLAIKLILNVHTPGAVRQGAVAENYLTKGIIIDEFKQDGAVAKFEDAEGQTTQYVKLNKALKTGDSIVLNFNWHYDLSEKSGREGKLDSTSFFLAYFYPRIAVMDDTQGWDFMGFTDAQEFYNEFNDYEVAVTVPKNFLVWGTGDLLNSREVLQPTFADKFTKSLTSDAVINVVTQKDLDAKNITTQNATNTWKWKANNISDVAFCISDNYVWDAASVIVDKKTGRRASAQSAYKSVGSGKFVNQVKHIQHSLEWYSNNWPGVPYPFPKSTIIQGEADMEYPMMANDSPQEDDIMQRFIAEHEIGHSYFPFYMGINEHRYGYMDEGWTTAFENMIGNADLGKEKANGFFKQFRVAGWATNPNDETQIPIITPVNILSGQAMGHNEYGKPALAYLALKDMLGDDLFRKSLHGFIDRWNGKHPLPWDMFNSFSNLSGKDLSWYWHNWFFTSYYMDVALVSVTANNTGYALAIKNIGGYAVPTDVLIDYTDGTKETVHQTAGIWEKNQQDAVVNITTKKKIAFVKLDGNIFMDANTKDNTWGTKPAGAAANVVNLDKYTGAYSSAQLPIKINFVKEGDDLTAEIEGQGKITLANKGKDTFSFDAAGVEMLFDTSKNEMTLKQGGGTFIFKKDK
jgi:hypothetical protein